MSFSINKKNVVSLFMLKTAMSQAEWNDIRKEFEVDDKGELKLKKADD